MKNLNSGGTKSGKVMVNPDGFEITAYTETGEEPARSKINPNKRHSKNNTIIGWRIYYNGTYQEQRRK